MQNLDREKPNFQRNFLCPSYSGKIQETEITRQMPKIMSGPALGVQIRVRLIQIGGRRNLLREWGIFFGLEKNPLSTFYVPKTQNPPLTTLSVHSELAYLSQNNQTVVIMLTTTLENFPRVETEISCRPRARCHRYRIPQQPISVVACQFEPTVRNPRIF